MIKFSVESSSKRRSISLDKKESYKKDQFLTDLAQSQRLNQNPEAKHKSLPSVFAHHKSLSRVPSVPALSKDSILQTLNSKFPNEFNNNNQDSRAKERSKRIPRSQTRVVKGSPNEFMEKLLEKRLNKISSSSMNISSISCIKEEKEYSVYQDTETRISEPNIERSVQKIDSSRSLILCEDERLLTQQSFIRNKNRDDFKKVSLARLKQQLLPRKGDLGVRDVIKKYAPKAKKTPNQYLNDSVYVFLHV